MGNLRQRYTDEEWDQMQERSRSVDSSGFFDLPKSCVDPRHYPPSHINIPHGKGYRHICPTCGKSFEIVPPQIMY